MLIRPAETHSDMYVYPVYPLRLPGVGVGRDNGAGFGLGLPVHDGVDAATRWRLRRAAGAGALAN